MTDSAQHRSGATAPPPGSGPARRRSGPALAYGIALFVAGSAAVTTAAVSSGGWLPEKSPWLLLFFLLYGLFTIQVGYVHPRVGYVSFDRVAQVASILVLGPVAAAWINGLASLVWPLQRLYTGKPLREVASAALHNSGLMSLMIIGCGELYAVLDGPLPLTTIDTRTGVLLVLLIASMQLVNELLMTVDLLLAGRGSRWIPHGFSMAMETGSALAGVLVAICINRMELPVVALVLLVLGLGMLALNKFARMRNRLEALVDERTHVLHDKMREFEALATQDQLTGLVNRRYAEDTLRRCIEDFDGSQRDFSIGLIDLDHFKDINDRYSHETGDEVLRSVARILVSHCRQSDVVARFGGEEFLVCFQDTGVAAAARICEALRGAVEAAEWSSIVPEIKVSLSAGVAGMQPGLTRSLLLKEADARLYRAKHAGRNCVIAA